MQLNKITILAFIGAVLIGFFLYKANPGFHLSNCTCSYKFNIVKVPYDCARYCANEEITPISKVEKLVNQVLLTR